MRERAKNDIAAQQDFTNFMIRKRINQTQKARNELDWQKLEVRKYIFFNFQLIEISYVTSERSMQFQTTAANLIQVRVV